MKYYKSDIPNIQTVHTLERASVMLAVFHRTLSNTQLCDRKDWGNNGEIRTPTVHVAE